MNPKDAYAKPRYGCLPGTTWLSINAAAAATAANGYVGRSKHADTALFQRFHSRLDTNANEPKRRLRRRMGHSTSLAGVDIFYIHISVVTG